MRIYQYMPMLQAKGIEMEVLPLLSDDYLKRLYAKQSTNWFEVCRDYLVRAIGLLRARKFDLVWIEKELFPNFPAWFEQILSALDIPYVVDYDDAIFHNYDLNAHLLRKPLVDKIDKVMRNAALVICGNAYLGERAHSAGASHVEIVPTVIDLERYEVLHPAPGEHIVVGWVGSPSTVKYLDLVAPALKALAAEFPLQLRVIGTQFAWPGLNVDCRPWAEASEVSAIQDFDIGIMPLLDSPWERGKCGYKLIQYMACGKPVVASPVGVNKDIVQHGRNGFLASNELEWIEFLSVLLKNCALRNQMGKIGRTLVEEKYCIQRTAPYITQLFAELIRSKGKKCAA
jgi:glycosyltransferase involved in cell wall biosynthesis